MPTYHGSRWAERGQVAVRLPDSVLVAVLALVMLAIALPAAAQQAVQVKAVTEAAETLLGKSFFFQVQVLGGTDVGTPDLAAFRDFDVREIPLSWVMNWAADRLKKFDLKNGTTYLYRLVALRPGLQSIPAVTVEVDGSVYASDPQQLRVTVPPPSDDFKLSLSLSKKRVFAGEAVVLRGLWMARLPARFYSYVIPILRHPAFDPGGAANSAGSSFLRGVASLVQNLSGQEGTALINGILYHTLRFQRVLLPQEAGNFDFPPATVQIFGVGEDPDSPQQGGRWNMNRTVIAAQALRIQVLPLPAAGRPANFSGLVADKLQLKATVTPMEMNVGDPVTLAITLSGPGRLEKAELPPLGSLAGLSGHFSFRADPLKTLLAESEKTFSQTIRVSSEEVRELPSLEIPYFDTRTASYQLARTNPVPITVRPTRILTSSDLEGRSTPAASSEAALRPWGEGILFNYGDSGLLLANQPGPGAGYLARDPAVALLLALPLAGLLLLLILRQRRRAANRKLTASRTGSSREAARPFRKLQEKLELLARTDQSRAEEILAAWREYLAARLGLQPGKMTWQEVEVELQQRGLKQEALAELRAIRGRFELENYAGRRVEQPEEGDLLAERIGRIAFELELRLS